MYVNSIAKFTQNENPQGALISTTKILQNVTVTFDQQNNNLMYGRRATTPAQSGEVLNKDLNGPPRKEKKRNGTTGQLLGCSTSWKITPIHQWPMQYINVLYYAMTPNYHMEEQLRGLLNT